MAEIFVTILRRDADALRRWQGVSDTLLRLLFAPIFIIGGLGHFVEFKQMLARIADSPWHWLVLRIGDPGLLLKTSGVVFVIFGVCLALGYRTRLAALALFVTLVPITAAIHIAPGHVGPLLRNVAILGGLIHFFIRGGGVGSLDLRRG